MQTFVCITWPEHAAHGAAHFKMTQQLWLRHKRSHELTFAASRPCVHLRVDVGVVPLGWVFVSHGGYPAGLAALGEGADVQDAQDAAANTQLVLQDEAVLGAERQTWAETSRR